MIRSAVGGPAVKGALGEMLAGSPEARMLYAPVPRRQLLRIHHIGVRGAGLRGVDAFHIVLAEDGTPLQPQVVEVKWGTRVQPAETQVGRQLSAAWTRRQLETQANLLRGIARQLEQGKLLRRPPSGWLPRRAVEIPTPQGRLYLWQDWNGRWYYAGPQGAARSAVRQLRGYEEFLRRQAAVPEATSRVLVRVRPEQAGARVTAWEVTDEAARRLRAVGNTLIRQDLLERKAVSMIARALREQTPQLAPAEAHDLASALVARYGVEEAVEKGSFTTFFRRRAVLTGGLVALAAVVGLAGLEMAMGRSELAVRQAAVGVAALATGFGTQAAVAHVALQTSVGRAIVRWLARTMYLPFDVALGVTAASAAGLAMAAASAYLAAAFGLASWQEVHAVVAGSLLGLAAGWLAQAALWQLALTVGTASTGTAISSLSGAAATSAALAWLGGGSLASGGFGMAGGALVLWASFTVVWVVAEVLILMWVYYQWAAQEAWGWYWTAANCLGGEHLKRAVRHMLQQHEAMRDAAEVRIRTTVTP